MISGSRAMLINQEMEDMQMEFYEVIRKEERYGSFWIKRLILKQSSGFWRLVIWLLHGTTTATGVILS